MSNEERSKAEWYAKTGFDSERHGRWRQELAQQVRRVQIVEEPSHVFVDF